MNYHKLPKIELHLHLDCSLSFELVAQLSPGITHSEYLHRFVAPNKCDDLADYIKRAVAAIALMQTQENLRLVIEDLFRQLSEDRVIYAELRFAPLEHIREGLSPVQVVEAIEQAVDDYSSTFGITAGIILCTLRHYSATQSMDTVKLVEHFRGSKVVGFDIAADEAGFPITNHISAFRYAFEHGLNCTAHAGEACGPESVWESMEQFRPKRIGHGVRSAEDPELLQFLKERDIHLEVCPTSNVQTNVFPTIYHHNVHQILNSGVSMGINTDCRTISDVTLTSEYQLLQDVFGWSQSQFFRCNCEAARHAFTEEEVKKQLLMELTTHYRPATDRNEPNRD